MTALRGRFREPGANQAGSRAGVEHVRLAYPGTAMLDGVCGDWLWAISNTACLSREVICWATGATAGCCWANASTAAPIWRIWPIVCVRTAEGSGMPASLREADVIELEEPVAEELSA